LGFKVGKYLFKVSHKNNFFKIHFWNNKKPKIIRKHKYDYKLFKTISPKINYSLEADSSYYKEQKRLFHNKTLTLIIYIYLCFKIK